MFKDDPAIGKMTKSALLAFLMQKYAGAPGDCTIVGHTKSDFVAAKDNGIESVGVTWGYGKPEELALASRIAQSPSEI
jgi:phosphoglycolate phosphatase